MTECLNLKLTKGEISGELGRQNFTLPTCLGNLTQCRGMEALCAKPILFKPVRSKKA